ncbi:hypothetical protein G6F66_014811 [Rhizopus arrhizus]|nr:hypothetical protein G6F66_014811 [Rhizopus arrhizus]
MVRGRAGRHRRARRALQAGDDAQLARQHVDDGLGHIEGRDLLALVELDGLLFDAEQAADAGADDGAHAIGIGLGDLQARVMQGHERGAEAVMDERVHLLGILATDPELAEEFVVGDRHQQRWAADRCPNDRG